MHEILVTEQAGTGHVYTRRVRVVWTPDVWRSWAMRCDKCVRQAYNAHPGTLEAVGCWSRVRDLPLDYPQPAYLPKGFTGDGGFR